MILGEKISGILWRDSRNFPGWFSKADAVKIAAQDEIEIPFDGGIFIGETEKYISIAQARSNGFFLNIVKIPKCSIIPAK